MNLLTLQPQVFAPAPTPTSTAYDAGTGEFYTAVSNEAEQTATVYGSFVFPQVDAASALTPA